MTSPNPLRDPFVADVQVRLVGQTIDVAAAIEIITRIFTVTDMSTMEPARGRQVRWYATISRRVPLTGGDK